MSVHFCLVLLALSSLTAASDPDCEELFQPLEDRRQVYGKWIYRVGTSFGEETLRELKLISSAWIELSPIPGSDDINMLWSFKMNGACPYGSLNSTHSGNSTTGTFHFNIMDQEHVLKRPKTCPDCILWTVTPMSSAANGETKRGRNLYVLTKSGKLVDAHLEVFKKQAACLNFPADFHFGEITDLCPDGKEAATDVKEEEQ